MLLGAMPSWLEGAPPEEVDAGPVLLRRWRLADAEVLNRLVTDNYHHLRPWMPWAQPHPSIEVQLTFLGQAQEAWEGRTDFGYAVTLPDAQIVGGMGLHKRQGAGTLEIGYWIGVGHTGHGYATAGSAALMGAALALPGVGVGGDPVRRGQSRLGCGSRQAGLQAGRGHRQRP
jgi:ribosomal-protein-serine acetyltransferase